MPNVNKNILIHLIEYIKKNDLNVIFVIPKKLYIDKAKGIPERLNTIIDIMNNNNLKIINFNTLDDFEIDWKKDLHNWDHLNVYGSTKYTMYFSKYLKKYYQLEDHRNKENDLSWEREYQRFKDDYKKYTNQNFDDIIKKY